MSQISRRSIDTIEETSSNAAFSFSIESKTQIEPSITPKITSLQELPLGAVPHRKDILIPLVVILNLGLIQLGLYLNFFDRTHSTIMSVLHAVSILGGSIAFWFCCRELITSNIDSLKKLQLPSEILLFVSVVALSISGVLTLFDTTLVSQVWTYAESFGFTAAIVALLRAAQLYGLRWFVAQCTLIPDQCCKTIHLLDEKNEFLELDVDVALAKPGSMIRLKEQEILPFDCLVIKGVAEVLERKLSGEGLVRIKGKGDTLYAGSTVIKGNIDCKVQSTPDESYITSFLGIVYRNLNEIFDHHLNQSSLESKLSTALLFIATVSGVFWYGTGKGFAFALMIFSSVLLVGTFPVALKMSSFLFRRAILSSFSKGIIFKDFLKTHAAIQKTDVVAIDYNSRALLGQINIEGFELIDERVDKTSLLSVLISIFGRSDIEFHTVATQYLRNLVDDVILYELSAVELYEDPSLPINGIGAFIEGIEFTIGSEELLIARGVQVQASEVTSISSESQALYIAMQDEIVARLLVTPRFTHDAKDLISALRASHIRPVFCSQESFEEVHPVAQRLGFDVSDIFAPLTISRFIEKIDSLKPVGVLANNVTPKEVVDTSTISFGFFDEYTWDVESTQVTLFSHDLSRIPWIFRTNLKLSQVCRRNLIFAGALSLLLVLSAVTGFGEPGVISLTTLIASLYVYFNSNSSLLE